jgi:hypothetical protein
MSFEKLSMATTVVSQETIYFERMGDWQAKHQALSVQIRDLPTLVLAYKTRNQAPYANNPHITLTDEIPRIRLANACEATTNTLYSMCEIAAQFGNRVSGQILPCSFNDLRKKVQSGKLNGDLNTALGDLQWYEKVRELRTEWAHYSTVFIGEEKGEPLLIVRANRRSSDRKQFGTQIQCCVPDIIEWTKKAIEMVDRYAGYLLNQHVLPKFRLDAVITVVRRDHTGMPIILEDGLLSVESITIREYFRRCGVIVGP